MCARRRKESEALARETMRMQQQLEYVERSLCGMTGVQEGDRVLTLRAGAQRNGLEAGLGACEGLCRRRLR